MKNKISKLFYEIVRFNIVGIINTGLTYLIFSAIFFFFGNYHWALICDYLFGMTFSLILNHRFTFRIKKALTVTVIMKMFFMYFLLLLVNDYLLGFCLRMLSLNEYISQIIVLGFIAICSFFVQKFFVFFDYSREG